MTAKTKRIFAAVVIAVVLAFFWISLSSNWERVQSYSIEFSVVYLLSFVIFALAVVSSGALAGAVLRALGQRSVNIVAATRAHLGSWIIRYIPSVAQPIYKMNWAAQNGIRRSVGMLGFLYEFAFMQIASIVGALALIVVVRTESLGNDDLLFWGIILSSTGIASIFALRYLVNPVATKIIRMRKLESAERLPTISWPATIALLIGFVFPRALNGLGVAFVALILIPTYSVDDVAVIAAAYTIASAVGVLWVFVPSGIGVREATFVALMVALGFEIVDGIVISVVVRLVSTLADALVALIFVGLKYVTPVSDAKESR